MKICKHLAIPVCVFLLSGSLDAQVLYGTFVGNVTDQQSAAVVGATVQLTNKAVGYNAEVKTDVRGAYEFRNLAPGTYDLKITASGFATFEASGLSVIINNVTRLDAQMKVGQVTETITVGAEAVALQTDKSDLHTDLSSREMTQIPVSGFRNYQSLMDFVPGSMPAAFQNASTDTPARALTTNINGTARNSNNTRIDGAASVMTWLPHHSLYVPPLESLETVNVSTNNFDAEQGMAGGAAITVVTKSGTNDLHGVAFWYHNNHAWGAKNLFFNPNTPAGPNTPQNIQNQYGGTLGGPIKKDRLFFFASWEGTTLAERGNGLLSVPTDRVRAGNFAGLTTVYDPTTGDSAGRGRTPFPNNQIPASGIHPASRILLGMLPNPTQGGEANNFFASAPYYFKRDMVDGKLNWTPTANTNVFLKYSNMIAPVSASPPLGEALGGYPGGASGAAGIGTGNNNTKVFGAGISYVIGPTLLFDANFGGTFMDHDTTGPDFGRNVGLEVLKIPGTNGTDVRQSGFPIFDITGYTSFGNVNNWSPVLRNDRVYTYVANLNWTRGAHNIRMGIDLIQHQMNHWQPEANGWSPRGRFNFRNGVTGLNGGPSANSFNAVASFLLGLPAEMGKAYQFYDPMRTREFQQGYYIRDNWQVSRKLSVNLGMRFEHFPIMHRGEFGIERYDPDSNKVLIGGRGSVPRGAGTEAISVMFAPRVGLAYKLTEKTVVRAGYGITNDPYPVSRPLRSPFPAVILDEYRQVNSFTPAGTLTTGIGQVRFPDLSSGLVDIPNTVATNSLQAGKFRRGYIQSYNFTIQKELPFHFLLTTGYAGTHSVRQAVTYFEGNAGLVPGAGSNGRPLFQKFGVNVNRAFFIPMADQRYDAWQTNATKRFSSGLFTTISYTWSKTIGINAGNSDQGLNFYVPSQFSKNRGLTSFDRTHVFQTAWVYELPAGKGKRWANSGAISQMLGGWQLNWSVGAFSGSPFTVNADGASLNAAQNTQVADQITPTVGRLGGVGPGNPFYDRSAFAPVREARFGNTGLNILRGPKQFNLNTGVFRQFNLTERANLQFRAEGLNVTNTPFLNNPASNVSTPATFMQITSTSNTNGNPPQRQFRFGLRVAF